MGIASYVLGTWHQLVVTGALDAGGGAADRIRIYLDSAVITDHSSFTCPTDWSGGDAAGLAGGAGGDIGGDVGAVGPVETNYSTFAVRIAVMNFYQNTVLSDAQILADYNAWTSPSVDTASVNVALNGVNDGPDATDDLNLTGPTEDDASFSETLDP